MQQYAWGRRGASSLVARLSGIAADPDPAVPYAELWMGTHPAAPSAVLPGGEPLGTWLARNPAALGPAVAARWAGDLPFLFKVTAASFLCSLARCLLPLLARPLCSSTTMTCSRS